MNLQQNYTFKNLLDTTHRVVISATLIILRLIIYYINNSVCSILRINRIGNYQTEHRTCNQFLVLLWFKTKSNIELVIGLVFNRFQFFDWFLFHSVNPNREHSYSKAEREKFSRGTK